MPDDSSDLDAEIIHAAYAEKVKEAFKVFADNIAVGEGEKSSRDRFVRTLVMMRRARDAALEATRGGLVEANESAEAGDAPEATASEPLSAEDQALIEQALSGTTGARPVTRPVTPLRRW